MTDLSLSPLRRARIRPGCGALLFSQLSPGGSGNGGCIHLGKGKEGESMNSKEQERLAWIKQEHNLHLANMIYFWHLAITASRKRETK